VAHILQGASPLQGPVEPSTEIGPTPDYKAETDRARLELGGDGLDRLAFSRRNDRTLGDEIAAASWGDEISLARRAGYRRLAEAIGS
jgi:hypothetical protein